MRLGGVENKARLAMALFVLALLLTIGLSLSLYSQARRELANQNVRQTELEAKLLSSLLSGDHTQISGDGLKHILQQNSISATAAFFSADKTLIALASTIDQTPDIQTLLPKAASPPNAEVRVRNENGFDIAEIPARGFSMLVIARPASEASSPVIFYVASYQIIALVLGLGLVFVLVHWLLRPYHRMIEAVRGSPVHASTAKSESEFVVETFQALVEEIRAKERELAQLHVIERNRAERSEQFSDRLIANIPSGLVAINSEGVVTSANARALEIFGEDELRQDLPFNASSDSKLRAFAFDYRDFFKSAPRMVKLIGLCLADGTAFRREEAEVLNPDGRQRHLGLSISPISFDTDSIEGALCLMTDLTEVIELRERMKLQESLANLGEMAAGLAHEFKNSLATIYGYVQLIEAQSESSNSAENQQQVLNATLNEVQLLTRLVTDFLNFARPQKLNLSPINMRSMIEDCADEISPHLNRAGIELRIEGNFTNLAGDESLLRRAFVNLLRNAAEAIDPQTEEKLIEVTGSIDRGTGRLYSHVRIRDTGSGISSEDLHRIFIPFFTTKSRGYGIGLAIVQKILVAHGGSVSVESSYSSGTTFHCRLPLIPLPDTMEQA